MIHRTDTPGRELLDALLHFRFFIPHIPIILAWILLGSKKGMLNSFATDALGLAQGPFDVFSYAGIIVTGILGWSTFLYVFISPAFRAMDASLEESARMSGAGNQRTLLRITVPLLGGDGWELVSVHVSEVTYVEGGGDEEENEEEDAEEYVEEVVTYYLKRQKA